MHNHNTKLPRTFTAAALMAAIALTGCTNMT